MRKILILMWCLLAGLAWAKPVQSNHVEAELVLGLKTAVPGQVLPAALRLKMEHGWHVYWKNPGVAGYPPRLSWTLPKGVTAGELLFPYPKRGEIAGLTSYLYEDEVLLPLNLTVGPDASGTLHLKVDAEWLACKESCIPGQATLEASVNVGKAPEPSESADAIQAAQQKLPLGTGLTIKSLTVADGKFVLDFASELVPNPKKAEFFPASAEIVRMDAPQEFKDGRLTLAVAEENKSPKLLEGVLVVDEVAFEVKSEAKAGPPPAGAGTAAAASQAPQGSILEALIGAFVGGMILNLMPCVFPVLSLKVLGLVDQSGKEGHKPWVHGLVFALGVLVSFWAISGLLLLLRSSGEQLGWGFQLQSPRMVAGMACLFFLIALNLFGVFEVGEGLTRLGEYGHGKTGFADAFFSGALATLVATPCSAPFMGAAVGFALTQPPFWSIAIFTTLGCGMAFPYVLLTSFPQLLRFLPRPGAWMETFKHVMAFPMLLTVVWFLHVLGKQIGIDALAQVLVALVSLGFAAWILGRWAWDPRSKSIRTRARFASMAIGVTTMVVLMMNLGHKAETIWQPFSPEKVAAARAQGKPVFIDFTADWCLSCKANEKLALDNSSVLKRFSELGVVTFKADWTSRDETITRTLAQFGRSGVPLYVYYPVNSKEAVVLPEVLTPQIVLDALK